MGRLRSIISVVGLRYSAIAIQFLLVILISRKCDVDTAGLYFIIFGTINSTYFLAGFGIPDGLVKEVAERIASDDRASVFAAIAKCGIWTVCASISTAVFAGAIALVIYWNPQVVILSAIWWVCYALTFLGAQGLVALQRPALGGFFFYPAINIALLFTLLPYLLMSDDPKLAGLLTAAVLGSLPMALLALTRMWLAVLPFRLGATTTADIPIRPLLDLGLRIAIGRSVQTSIYWIPTWIAGLTLTPSDAAILGLASRLNNALSAVMAAIRFVVRPEIVAAAFHNRWADIAIKGRAINTIATAFIALAILTYLVAGQAIIIGVFGSRFATAFWPLLALMIGTLAEAAGGVVDEVLKMTGKASVVLASLCCAVLFEIAACWAMAANGTVWIAGGQSITLLGLYAVQLLVLWRTRRVLLLPTLSISRVTSAFDKARSL